MTTAFAGLLLLAAVVFALEAVKGHYVRFRIFIYIYRIYAGIYYLRHVRKVKLLVQVLDCPEGSSQGPSKAEEI